MPKIAIYTRVSTEEQAKKGVSLAAQEEALKNYCKTYNYEIYKIYRDKGKSAKNIKGRQAIQQLLEDAQAKRFDAILVYKLDRFSRSLKDLILTIENLKKWGIDFVSLQDKIETTSASGKLMFHIISSFAEFERDIIGERTKFGMSKKARDGSIVTKAPLGYTIKNKRLLVDIKIKDKVQEIYKEFINTDISLNKLAKKYNFSVRGIIKLLKNQTYLGSVKFDNKAYKGIHQSIISKELFKAAQDKLQSISKDKFTKKLFNLESIFTQGDSRYCDPLSLSTVYNFLTNKAIIIDEKSIENIPKPEENVLKDIPGPQKEYKYIAKLLLIKKGYKNILFEKQFMGGKADVLGETEEEIIAVECGPCRISKVIDYLCEPNTRLWIISQGRLPWNDPLFKLPESKLLIIRKGPNWDKYYGEYKSNILKIFQKVKSPLDSL